MMPPLLRSEADAGPVGEAGLDLGSDGNREGHHRCDENGARIRIVLRLRDQVRGDPGRDARRRYNRDLAGAREKSIAQSLATCALAAATCALPGPTILSTRGIVSIP